MERCRLRPRPRDRTGGASLTALDAPGTPLRPAFGKDTFDRLTAAAERERDERAAWESPSHGADFDEQ